MLFDQPCQVRSRQVRGGIRQARQDGAGRPDVRRGGRADHREPAAQ